MVSAQGTGDPITAVALADKQPQVNFSETKKKPNQKRKKKERGWDFKGKSLWIQQITTKLLEKDPAPFSAAHQRLSGKPAPSEKLQFYLPAVAVYEFYSPQSVGRVEFHLLQLANVVWESEQGDQKNSECGAVSDCGKWQSDWGSLNLQENLI